MAATSRKLAGTDSVEPTGSYERSWSTRSSFTWRLSGSSPISSRKSVPPSAAAMRPRRAELAPVNAPRTWPKSSLSSSASGMAPQFTGTRARPARGLRSWMRRANTSLPTPVSPVMRTVASLAAMRLQVRTRSTMGESWPCTSAVFFEFIASLAVAVRFIASPLSRGSHEQA